MDSRELLDKDDINQEFKKLDERFALLQNRFLAVAMDYNHYIENSWGEKEIYKLRDEVSYRLFSAKFHIELLLRHHSFVKFQLEERFKKEPDFFSRQYLGPNPLFEHYQKQVSAIFDSTIFHMTSSFDYIATLCNYICGQNKQEKYKWTKLSKAVRDENNSFSKTKIVSTIDSVDREFAGKLYNHRSYVIHSSSDQNRYFFSMVLGQNGVNFVPRFIIGQNLTREFSELKSLNKTHDITVVYAAFWTINKTLDKITDILFSLKKQMVY